MKAAATGLLLLAGILLPGARAADYYVDPVTGSMANPGTALSPWSTLAEVFAAGKTFQAGDHVYLRRGNHGVVTVTGINTGDVFVAAEPGHTPAVRLSLLNAHHWHFRGLTILARVEIDNQTNENSDDNTFENCYLPNGGFAVFGNRITLRGNHIRNGGIHFGFHANSGLVSSNVIEDFYSDAMNIKGNANLFEYNLVMNAHKVSGNHNDMLQGWATSGNVLRGNEFRAYSDPGQPDLASPGISDVQGIGCFDGWYEDWVVENNVLFVDHAIGIWFSGAKRCKIRNNTVVRCGQTAAISSRLPSIAIHQKKSGAASVNNVVENNAAERFELTTDYNAGVSMGTNLANAVVAKSAFGSTYLNWARKDLHLRATAAALIDAGTSSNAPPALDADRNPRPNGAAWDCGAFEYGYTTADDTTAPSKPTGLSAVVVAGYGVDLRWTASTDNRRVAGYDIFRNGVWLDGPTRPHGGRMRAGANYLDIVADTTGSYTVQAFDHSGNRSPMSDPAGGTPPVPDEEAPSAPGSVAAAAVSSRAILATWSASTDNVAVVGYEVYRDGNRIATVTGTNHLDAGLAASTWYSYTVRALDRAGNLSTSSAPAAAATLAPDVTPPSAPTNVVATAVSSGSIAIRWAASTDNVAVAGYEILRDGEAVGTATGTNFADTGLSALTEYRYTVRAFDEEGNLSATSAPPAVATTLEPVPLLVGEPFEYAPAANLNGADGGAGWGGPWVVGYHSSLPATVEAGDLGVYPGLAASGNHLKFWTKGNGNVYETLDRPFEDLIVDGGQTIWLGMVAAVCNAKNAATWTLAGLTTDADGTNAATLFQVTENSVPAPFKFGSATLFSGDTNFTPHLVLVKIAMSGDAGPETLTAYADPDLGADEGTWTGVTRTTLYANGGLIGFSYRGGRASTATPNTEFFMDEIRLGATWQAAVGQTVLPGDTTAPSTPANVSAAAQSSSSILVAWSPSTDDVGVVGYDVYRDGALAGSSVTTSYLDTGLPPARLYSYTVRARDAATNVSAASLAATAMTPALPGALVEEPFDYEATNLVGLSGGTGWSGGWIVDSHYDYEAGRYEVADGALAAYPGLAASGRYGSFLSGGNGVYYPYAQRNLATPIADDGGEYWLAFQLQASSYHKDSTYTLVGATTALLRLKTDVTGMDFQFLGGTYHTTGDTNAHLFLIRMQMSGDTNAERAWLYYDPDLSAGPAAWTALRTNSLVLTNALTAFRSDSARAGSTGYRVRIDEIRLATTWQAAVGQGGGNPDADGDGMPDAWELVYFGSTTNAQGAADHDWDGDGLNNREEYGAGTNPTNAASVLTFSGLGAGGPAALVLQWQSVSGKTYAIHCATNLLAGFLATGNTNLLAVGGAMSRTVAVDQADGRSYRVVVDP